MNERSGAGGAIRRPLFSRPAAAFRASGPARSGLRRRPRPWPGSRRRGSSPFGPWGEQVAVVGAGGVARLAGGVGPDRAVPVAGVGDDPERGAGGLVVGVRGAVDGVRRAAAGQRAEVEPASEARVDRVAQRVRQPDVLEGRLAVPPAVDVGPEPARRARPRPGRAPRAGGRRGRARVGPKARVGLGQAAIIGSRGSWRTGNASRASGGTSRSQTARRTAFSQVA